MDPPKRSESLPPFTTKTKTRSPPSSRSKERAAHLRAETMPFQASAAMGTWKAHGRCQRCQHYGK